VNCRKSFAAAVARFVYHEESLDETASKARESRQHPKSSGAPVTSAADEARTGGGVCAANSLSVAAKFSRPGAAPKPHDELRIARQRALDQALRDEVQA